VLGGKLLIKQGDRVIGHLGAGDVIGYMSYLDFPGYNFLFIAFFPYISIELKQVNLI